MTPDPAPHASDAPCTLTPGCHGAGDHVCDVEAAPKDTASRARHVSRGAWGHYFRGRFGLPGAAGAASR